MESLALEVERAIGRQLGDDFREALDAIGVQAKSAWPEIELPLAKLAAFLATNLPKTAGEASKLHAADIYLVLACAEGSREAQRAFSDQFLGDVPSFVRRIDKSASFADEVRQELAASLLLRRDGAEIRLAQYQGRGPLKGFLRVAATRAALNLKRNKGEKKERLSGRHADARAVDPEKAVMKKRDAALFRQAFEHAVSELDVDERNVLRLHYVDGLSIDEVAATYQIGRATAARWLAKAKEKIVRSTLDELVSSASQSRKKKEWLEVVESQFGSSLFNCLRGEPRKR